MSQYKYFTVKKNVLLQRNKNCLMHSIAMGTLLNLIKRVEILKCVMQKNISINFKQNGLMNFHGLNITKTIVN